jgi:hypothetical protein
MQMMVPPSDRARRSTATHCRSSKERGAGTTVASAVKDNRAAMSAEAGPRRQFVMATNLSDEAGSATKQVTVVARGETFNR